MAQELMVDVHGPSLPPVAEKLERLLGGANESRPRHRTSICPAH